MPSSVSTANALPGTAALISSQTSTPTAGSIVRVSTASRVATSQTSAPLEMTARPWPPTWSKTSSAQRNGRPVTKTTGTPPSSSWASTCCVYAETVLSERTSVPSRSVATSLGSRSLVTPRP